MSLLYYLPPEILLIIFDLCDIYTLLQLRRVCKNFDVISTEILNKKSNHLLATNQISKKFRERCKPLLSTYRSKFVTHYNWQWERFGKKNIFPLQTNFIKELRGTTMNENCLKMTRNTIWLYDKNKLLAFNRAKNGNISRKNVIRATCDRQFSSIAYCNDIIISGHVDGSIRHWRIESLNNINNIQQLKVHSNVYDEYVSNIEVTSQHIISSSSNLIKLQKNTFENNAEEKETIYWKGRKLIRSISLNPTEKKVAASAEQWFLIYDINKNCQVMDKCIDGNTCYQLLWQDTHTILMLYESYIKQMDTRTSKFVRTWDASVLDNIWCDLSRNLLSLRSDYLYTFMTGTEDNTVILWDQRLSKFINTFCINSDINSNDPVFFVEFDSTHIYAITNQLGVVELDFQLGYYSASRTYFRTYFSQFT
ncbi:uncharacterized protein [Linepithema humile]|uniref:uncharacterized protein isoform X2 n=1 Tax=Linepithema humile TaxID=83485 RepID=UPI00351E4658